MKNDRTKINPRFSLRSAVKNRHGFSLLELLVVIAIIALMSGLAVSAFNNLGRTSSLSSGARALASEIAIAAQLAASRNKTVEIRIYSGDFDQRIPASVALVLDPDGSPNWAGRPVQLPLAVQFATNTAHSSLFNLSSAPASMEAPPALQGRTYYPFRIRPDGRTDLSLAGEPWFISLLDAKSAPGNNTPSDNFITIVVDPLTSKVRSYQP